MCTMLVNAPFYSCINSPLNFFPRHCHTTQMPSFYVKRPNQVKGRIFRRDELEKKYKKTTDEVGGLDGWLGSVSE